MKSIKPTFKLSVVCFAIAASSAAFAQSQLVVAEPASSVPGSSRPTTNFGTDNTGALVGSTVIGAGSIAQSTSIAIGNNANAGSNMTGIVTQNAIAIGNFSVAAGDNNTAPSIAIGNQAAAVDGSVALGNSALGRSENGVAIGASAVVADGADRSVAIGAGSLASQANTVSFGDVGATRRLTNLSDGVAATDAATVGQLAAIAAGGVDAVARAAAAAAQTTANGAAVSAATAATAAASAQNRADGAHVRIDNLDLQVGRHGTAISQNRADINNNSQRIDQTIAWTNGWIERHETAISQNRTDINNNSQRIDQNLIWTNGWIERHNTEIAQAQGTANAAQASATHAHVRIDNLDLRVIAAQNSATHAHTRIDNLDQRVTNHDTQITNLDQRTTANEGQIVNLHQQDTVHTTQIQQLASGAANDAGARAAIDATNSRVDQLLDQVSANRKEANAGVAGTAAMVASMPVAGALEPGQTAMGVGAGAYAGQGAFAISATRRLNLASDSMFAAGYARASVAITAGKPVLAAGFSFLIR